METEEAPPERSAPRWRHETHLASLHQREGRLDWVRMTSVEASRMYFDNEGDTVHPDAFVELVVNLFVEQPGCPPIMGLACQVNDNGDDEIQYVVWYYNANEFYADFAGEVHQPVGKLHANETCEDTPAWLWPLPEGEALPDG